MEQTESFKFCHLAGVTETNLQPWHLSFLQVGRQSKMVWMWCSVTTNQISWSSVQGTLVLCLETAL